MFTQGSGEAARLWIWGCQVHGKLRIRYNTAKRETKQMSECLKLSEILKHLLLHGSKSMAARLIKPLRSSVGSFREAGRLTKTIYRLWVVLNQVTLSPPPENSTVNPPPDSQACGQRAFNRHFNVSLLNIISNHQGHLQKALKCR